MKQRLKLLIYEETTFFMLHTDILAKKATCHIYISLIIKQLYTLTFTDKIQ